MHKVDEVIERLRAKRAVVAIDRSPEGRTEIYGADPLCTQAADLLASMKEALERIANRPAGEPTTALKVVSELSTTFPAPL